MLPQLGPVEMMIIMAVAVLLFGKRLPEVGRSLGKGIVEFKKGLRGLESEFDIMGSPGPSTRRSSDDYHSRTTSSHEEVPTSIPKFEPPTSAPVPQMEYEAPRSHD